MKNYRLYPQSTDGHFKGVIEFVAPDDELALEIARRHAGGQACELWQGARLVARLG